MNIREMLQSFRPVDAPEPGQRFVDIGDRTAMARIAKEGRTVTRADYPPLTQQIQDVWALRGWDHPWRSRSVRDALSSTAIFRAVALIANTVGSLAVETYRNGELLPADEAPPLVGRPDPMRTPRVFYRNTAFDLATYGEAWWWIGRRDSNDRPISLFNVPPWEVTVDSGTNRLRPTIRWVDEEMDPRDMRQITFLPDPAGGLRGVGPLQLCGAAVSVAIESQEWAANYYAGGGTPPLWIKAAGSLGNPVDDPDGNTEAEMLKSQFMRRANNTPFVSDEGVEDVKELQANPQGGQMLDARFANKGDAANMFGIPGFLLEYSPEGRSLTYQNIGEVWQLFVKGCLQPNYLEPIEQEMSDLLPRSTTAHFNVDIFERADPKSRWETYNLMVPVLGPEEAAAIARQSEGITAGDIEFQPVPFAPAAAFPTRLPIGRTSEPVRCSGFRMLGHKHRPCNKLLSESGTFTGPCPRCGTFTDTNAVA